MDRFTALSRGTQVMLAASVLLLVDTLLPWQSVEAFGVEVASQSAWNGLGILVGLLTLALVGWLVATVFGVDIQLPVSATLVAAALAAAILLLTLIKVLTDDFSTIWAWIGLLLAVAIAVGAYLRVQETGGFDALRAEMPTRETGATGAGTTPGSAPPRTDTTDAAPPPQPPPPPEPPPPPSGTSTGA